jgi:hypothetical protein
MITCHIPKYDSYTKWCEFEVPWCASCKWENGLQICKKVWSRGFILGSSYREHITVILELQEDVLRKKKYWTRLVRDWCNLQEPRQRGRKTRWRSEQSGVRILARERYSSVLQNVPTGSRAQPTSYSMGTAVLSRGQIYRGVTLTTHFHLIAQVQNKWSCTSIPPICLHDIDRGNFTLTCFIWRNLPETRWLDLEQQTGMSA